MKKTHETQTAKKRLRRNKKRNAMKHKDQQKERRDTKTNYKEANTFTTTT